MASRVNGFTRFNVSALALGLAFLYLPIVILVIYSFNASRSTVVWSGFTFDWYGEVFRDRGLRQALQVSAIIAFVSALVSTAIGALTALAIVRRRFFGRDALSTLLLAPMVLPEIVMAVALLVFMVAMNVTLGYFSMIVSHVLISVPFATLIVRAAAASARQALLQTARGIALAAEKPVVGVTTPDFCSELSASVQ